MYVLKDANGYLSGYGLGTAVAAPAGHTAFMLDVAPEAYRALVTGLAGWGGDYRFVKLDGQGLPESYTPRELTAEELAEDAAAAAAAVEAEADGQAANIPGWATWDETKTLAWLDANVTDLASAKTALKAMARMMIALRNKTWPGLQE